MFGIFHGTIKGFRYVQTTLLFLSILYTNISEKSLTIAIVEMTNTDSPDMRSTRLNWTPTEKQYLLSSFYIGFILFHIPGGYLARSFGSKKVTLIAVLGSSLLNLTVPISVMYGGWQVFLIIRIVQGFLEALILPSAFEYLMSWTPKHEENLHSTLCFLAFDLGSSIGIGMAGVISASFLGWPYVFYMTAAMGIVWSIGWSILASNNPRSSEYISSKEQAYILENQGSKNLENMVIPWKSILTSSPCIAVFVTYISSSWGFLTLACETSIFLNAAFDLNIYKNTLISALPNMVATITNLVGIFVSEFLLRRRILSKRMVRILLTTLGMSLPAMIFATLGLSANADSNLVIALIIVCTGISGLLQSGAGVAVIDIAPNFCSMLIAIQMTLASLSGLTVPVVVSLIVGDEEHNILKWRLMFLLSAGVCVFGNMVFVLFGSSEEADWNVLKGKEVDGNEGGNKG